MMICCENCAILIKADLLWHSSLFITNTWTLQHLVASLLFNRTWTKQKSDITIMMRWSERKIKGEPVNKLLSKYHSNNYIVLRGDDDSWRAESFKGTLHNFHNQLHCDRTTCCIRSLLVDDLTFISKRVITWGMTTIRCAHYPNHHEPTAFLRLISQHRSNRRICFLMIKFHSSFHFYNRVPEIGNVMHRLGLIDFRSCE